MCAPDIHEKKKTSQGCLSRHFPFVFSPQLSTFFGAGAAPLFTAPASAPGSVPAAPDPSKMFRLRLRLPSLPADHRASLNESRLRPSLPKIKLQKIFLEGFQIFTLTRREEDKYGQCILMNVVRQLLCAVRAVLVTDYCMILVYIGFTETPSLVCFMLILRVTYNFLGV